MAFRLLLHGLLRKSFVPDRAVRELRDLTRCRSMLTKERARLSCRIQNVLEAANIKLASVATDVLAASGRAMLKAIVKGESDPTVLADLAQKRLRAKLPEFRLALTGCITDHHRFLLRQWLELLDTFEGKIAEFDRQIEEKVAPFQEVVTTWMAIQALIVSPRSCPVLDHQ
jgi:transposase